MARANLSKTENAARLGNLLLAAGSLALTLLALELLARATRREGGGEPIAASYVEQDPILGWRHVPGARVSIPLGDYAINRKGLRDLEREYAPADGVTRLLVLGDSFAEGFSVRFEDGVSQALERVLGAPGCGWEVVNAGTVGYSTDQEYLFYREEGWRYQARVVVLFFYYNDVLYNARGAVGETPKPLFTFAGGTPRVKNHPLPAALPFRSGRLATAGQSGGSAALDWLRRRLRDSRPRAYSALAALGLWPPLFPQQPSLELHVYDRHPPRPIEDAWQMTRNLLGALDQETRSRGARLVVAYVPSKMEVVTRDWELTCQRYGVDETTWDRGRLVRLLAEAGATAGFPVLDLGPALRRAEASVGSPYQSRGGHWTALGHRIAAEEVKAILERQGWVARCGP